MTDEGTGYGVPAPLVSMATTLAGLVRAKPSASRNENPCAGVDDHAARRLRAVVGQQPCRDRLDIGPAISAASIVLQSAMCAPAPVKGWTRDVRNDGADRRFGNVCRQRLYPSVSASRLPT
jgi:hypothetical protein